MDFLPGIITLAERAQVFSGKRVHVLLIANPVAGGFTIKKKARENKDAFELAVRTVAGRMPCALSCDAQVQNTAYHGHAGMLARSFFEKAYADGDPKALYMLIVAGGDGTSHDVQTVLSRMALLEGKKAVSEKICIVRLPFGTGNDGSDGRTLADTLSLFTENSTITTQSAVRIKTAGERIHDRFSFNIASVGIDAFVAYVTNLAKGKLPGDTYKLWVDLAVLFYNTIYPVGKMTVSAFREGSPVFTGTGKKVFALMGVSGERTYGSNQRVLPDTNNAALVSEMSLLEKLKLKGKLKEGKHSYHPEVLLGFADKMVITYREKILMQLDGEIHQLYPADFPLVFELTEPFIPIVKKVIGS